MRFTDNVNSSPSGTCTSSHAKAELYKGDCLSYDYDTIPTIELSCTAVTEYDIPYSSAEGEFDEDHNMTYAKAIVRRSSNESAMSLHGVSDDISVAVAEMIPEDVLEGGEETMENQRPEFISATVYKADKTTPIGIGLRMVKNRLRISQLVPGGLLGNATVPFRIGDRLISINNTLCEKMDDITAGHYLRSLTGPITLVVQNEEGNSNLVASMITKNSPDDISGIGLRDGVDCPVISSIASDGLFASSLLNVGNQVLSVNGSSCHLMDNFAAAMKIKEAPHTVTILSKTLGLSAAVVATMTHCHRRAKFVSATVYKRTADTPLGIGLTMRESRNSSSSRTLIISSIEGLLIDSPFRVGDTLVSINGKKCKGMTHKTAARLVKELRGEITLVASNFNGDPTLVETMVMKPPTDSHKTVVVLRKDEKGRTVVYNVSSKSFSAVSLKVGEMISLNGIPSDTWDLRTASKIVQNARRHVTIICKRIK